MTPAQNKQTILVVDDTAQNLTLVELYLRGTEFEVVTAESGHQALQLCREQAFDLIPVR